MDVLYYLRDNTDTCRSYPGKCDLWLAGSGTLRRAARGRPVALQAADRALVGYQGTEFPREARSLRVRAHPKLNYDY